MHVSNTSYEPLMADIVHIILNVSDSHDNDISNKVPKGIVRVLKGCFFYVLSFFIRTTQVW